MQRGIAREFGFNQYFLTALFDLELIFSKKLFCTNKLKPSRNKPKQKV